MQWFLELASTVYIIKSKIVIFKIIMNNPGAFFHS